MSRLRAALVVGLAASLILVAACQPPGPRRVVATGTFRALSYNIAGLPPMLTEADPETNVPLISPLLNGYDVVSVQEDFWFHDQLMKSVQHPYRTTKQIPFFNDGLELLSKVPYRDFARTGWITANGLTEDGNDALGPKGYSFARIEVASGVYVDIYNHHADAGTSADDAAARKVQYRQLADHIKVFSARQAVIVCGDTNLEGKDPLDEPILQEFLATTGTKDVARHLNTGIEKIDRFFFRSGDDVTLEPLVWRLAAEFVDAAGKPLSDHDAVNVDFRWNLLGY